MIGAAILGIVAGFLARALLPGKQELGFIATVLLGIAGALAGFFVFTELLGIGDSEAFDLGGLPGAVIGAIVLLYIYERLTAGDRERAAAVPQTTESREERREERRERRGERDRGADRG